MYMNKALIRDMLLVDDPALETHSAKTKRDQMDQGVEHPTGIAIDFFKLKVVNEFTYIGSS